MILVGREDYLRYAQTTWNDFGHAARSVGISLGPGLVAYGDGPSLNAYPPGLAACRRCDKYDANGK